MTEQQYLDDLGQDTANVHTFLAALSSAVPGVVPDDLLALLAGAASNPASLAVLAAALRQAPVQHNGRLREAAARR